LFPLYFNGITGRRVSRQDEAKLAWRHAGPFQSHDRLRFARTDMRLGTVAGPIGPREASGLSYILLPMSVS